MTDLEYIKRFSKINIRSICKQNGINEHNLWSGRTSAQNICKVRKCIDAEIGRLHIEDYNEQR